MKVLPGYFKCINIITIVIILFAFDGIVYAKQSTYEVNSKKKLFSVSSMGSGQPPKKR